MHLALTVPAKTNGEIQIFPLHLRHALLSSKNRCYAEYASKIYFKWIVTSVVDDTKDNVSCFCTILQLTLKPSRFPFIGNVRQFLPLC